MYLRKNELQEKEVVTKIEFEKVANDLLMISVIYVADNHERVPSYWRLLGRDINPPLEIGIDIEKKTIASMTAFVDVDCFKDLSLEVMDTIEGSIVVETDIFKRQNDYVDREGEYFIALLGNKLVCTFGSQNHMKEAVGNSRIKFLISHNDELCGFELYNLEESETEKIKSIQ